MEKPQIERREKIVEGIIIAAADAALYATKDGRDFHARNYGGSLIIDVFNETTERSIRIGAALHSLNPLEFEVDPAEHSDDDLDEVAELSKVAIVERENPLQNASHPL